MASSRLTFCFAAREECGLPEPEREQLGLGYRIMDSGAYLSEAINHFPGEQIWMGFHGPSEAPVLPPALPYTDKLGASESCRQSMLCKQSSQALVLLFNSHGTCSSFLHLARANSLSSKGRWQCCLCNKATIKINKNRDMDDHVWFNT